MCIGVNSFEYLMLLLVWCFFFGFHFKMPTKIDAKFDKTFWKSCLWDFVIKKTKTITLDALLKVFDSADKKQQWNSIFEFIPLHQLPRRLDRRVCLPWHRTIYLWQPFCNPTKKKSIQERQNSTQCSTSSACRENVNQQNMANCLLTLQTKQSGCHWEFNAEM